MAKILRILTMPREEKILREKSEDVSFDEIKSEQFHEFLDDLQETTAKSKLQSGWEAAGLSAIQVGVKKNVFLALNVNDEQMIEYINPKVEPLGEATDVQLEGCLSFPETVGYVERPKRCRVTYFDRYGNKHREKLSGFNARIVLHEYDHLLGVLFTDKMVEHASYSQLHR